MQPLEPAGGTLWAVPRCRPMLTGGTLATTECCWHAGLHIDLNNSGTRALLRSVRVDERAVHGQISMPCSRLNFLRELMR